MGGPGEAGEGGGTRREPAGLLRRLALARLALAGAIFAASLALAGGSAPARGFVAALAAAGLTSAITLGAARRGRSLSGLAAAQVVADVGVLTVLVQTTGASGSLFTVGYAVVVIYAALLLDSRGAFAAAALAGISYGGLLLLGYHGVVDAAELGAGDARALSAMWSVQTGLLVVAALLASGLVRETRRAGEALHRRTSDLANLRSLHERTVESLTSGLLTTEAGGRITSFNPEAERITGEPAAAVLGRPLEEVLPGAAAAALGEGGSGERRRARIAYRDRRGRELHLGVAGSPLRDGSGGAAGHVLIFQDVTPVVQMEKELVRSARLAAVGELAAAMAHELRNPLAAIVGSTQMLGGPRPRASAEETARLLEIVQRETRRLDKLLQDFLAFARPAPPKAEPVALARAVGEVLDLFAAGSRSEVRVEARVPDHLRVLVDGAQLRQLLWNLLRNAEQALPKGGSVRISATPTGGGGAQGAPSAGRKAEEPPGVELVVADDGEGMPPEVLERIFDPFFTTKPGGSGLGLATVYRIVEANGGRLRVESEPGRGTRFQIRLPAAEGRP